MLKRRSILTNVAILILAQVAVKELASRQAANNGAERGRFQTKFDAQNLDFKIFVLPKSQSVLFGTFRNYLVGSILAPSTDFPLFALNQNYFKNDF